LLIEERSELFGRRKNFNRRLRSVSKSTIKNQQSTISVALTGELHLVYNGKRDFISLI